MKIVSLFLITLFCSLNLLFGQNSIQTALNNFVNDPTLKHASVGFNLVELSSSKVIATHNPQLSLPTASTAKLFSTATALEILGPNYRPETRIYYDGEIDSSGNLKGNIWIRGGGDPTLGSKYFCSEENQSDFLNIWAQEIKKAGINSISGSVITDASEFGYDGAPDGWNWVDLGNYYGAGASGLTIYDNLVRLKFKTPSVAGKSTEIVSIEPYVPGLIIHNYVKSSKKSGDNSYIYGAPYSLDRFATGELPLNKSEFLVKGSLPDPEYQVAHELTLALSNNNISIQGLPKSVRKQELKIDQEHYSSKKMIHSHKGQSLIEIIKLTNHKSINLFAEHLVNLIGYVKTGNGSTKSGLKAIEDYWLNKINTSAIHLNDGSGLSRSNAISANNYTELLSYMYGSKSKDSFLKTLPISGESGTLKHVCKGQAAHGKVHAKSGTMTRIKSYAGYIYSSSGKKYAFAIIVNNQTGSTRNLRKKMEILFNRIATF